MIAVVAVGLAVWIIMAALCLPGWACTVGRLKRRWARRREHVVYVVDLPPAGDLTNPLPADCTDEQLEQAIFDRLFRDTVCREFPYDADKFAS